MYGGTMFTVVPVFIGIIAVITFGIVITSVVRAGRQWHSNNQQPVLNVSARIVSKRDEVRSHTHHDANTNMHRTTYSTDYYAAFEVESGDRIEFQISAQEYGLLAEGDSGELRFQGTRFLGFTRQY